MGNCVKHFFTEYHVPQSIEYYLTCSSSLSVETNYLGCLVNVQFG